MLNFLLKHKIHHFLKSQAFWRIDNLFLCTCIAFEGQTTNQEERGCGFWFFMNDFLSCHYLHHFFMMVHLIMVDVSNTNVYRRQRGYSSYMEFPRVELT